MKLLFFLTFLTMSGASEWTSAQCLNARSTSDQIAIPVVFQFSEKALRSDVLYSSLQPRLQLSSGEEIHPQSVEIIDEQLKTKFCLEAEKLPPENSKIYFLFGLRKLEANVRPTQWRETEFRKSDNAPLREGFMPIIAFTNQKQPDWLAVLSATLLQNQHGHERLEIELFNFEGRAHLGAHLTLRATKRQWKYCEAPDPSFATVPVSLRIEKGKLKVESGDPNSAELITREASLRIDGCSESFLETTLGPTGAIEANATLRIRYSFEWKNPKWKGRDTLSTSSEFLGLSFFNSHWLTLSGSRVYPRTIRVWQHRAR